MTVVVEMGASEAVDVCALHQEIWRAVRTLRDSEFRLAELLAVMEVGQRFRRFAASMVEYTEQMLGLRRGKGGDLLRIGRALPELVELRQAMADGDVTWTAAREVVKVAVPETEASWVRYAESSTSRQLERAVACSEKGDEAPAFGAVVPAPKRVRLVFEVAASEALLVRKAMVVLRARLGEEDALASASDGEVLAAMAEQVVADQSAATRPVSVERFQTVLQVCPSCEDTVQVGVADEPWTEVSEAVAAAASCDHVVVDMRPGPKQGAVSHAIPERVRRKVLHRDEYCCAVPGCRHAVWLALHHVVHKEHGGGHEVCNLLTVCSVHHGMIHEGDLTVERAGGGSFALDWRFG